MKIIYSLAASLLVTLSASAQSGPAQYVNPFIGTSNFGTTQPGPVVPMGLVSMSPFTTMPHEAHKINVDGHWCSTPYFFENPYCAGFTQVNLSGVGCPDLGSLLLMPTTGKLEVDVKKYYSKLTDQQASAGYYVANLEKYGVKAEMTTTTRTTLSRYTYPAGESNLLFNIGYGLTTESGGYAKIVSNTEIEGYKIMGDFCYGEPQSVIPIYFVAKLSKPAKLSYWKYQDEMAGGKGQWSGYSGKFKIYTKYNREMAGDNIGVAFSFPTTENEAVELRVGISYVSIANARQNLEAEQGTASFDKIHADAVAAWNKVLSVVTLDGGTDDEKVQFYTGLYHNYIHPNVLQDVNGEYPAMESGKTLKVKAGTDRMTMFSGWDVYRVTPMLGSIFYPERQKNMALSMMDMYRETGNLPKFEVLGQEFSVMEGDAALPYLTACYFLGLTKDIEPMELYQAMLKNATEPEETNRIRPRYKFYADNGYVPFLTANDNSVSQALEYYIADYSVAQVAKSLGRTDDYEMLMKRVNGWKKYFDKNHKLLHPVLPDGSFMPNFNPLMGENFEPSHGFHEGTSWNYSFAIPFDIEGLIKLHGSSKSFVDSLTVAFEKGRFDMGNEPDMGYPYYFSYVKGSEWLTQKWARECLKRYYGNKPGGLPGNDDAGTMSAWQMFTMMGIYPACPGVPEYVFSTPVFNKITIQLDPRFYTNKELVIEGVNASPENIYIEKIEVGGKPYKGYFISQDKLMNAGTVKIYCTNKPKK